MAQQEGQQVDTLPVQIYKKNAAGEIVADVISAGMPIPSHDSMVIDESLAPATTVITYSYGGVTVATKTITVSGTTTTIAVT